MSQEIERKFLVSQMPDLENLTPIRYERYFLKITDSREIRIQKKGKIYEYEEKNTLNNLSAEKIKKQISQEKFESLKQGKFKNIARDSYILSDNPKISLKKYHGDHLGLIRIEVEFNNKQEALEFKIPTWYGKEITDSPLGRDSKLVQLSPEEFKNLINS